MKIVHRLRQSIRRWRCGHFDHPYRKVRDPLDVSYGASIEDRKWCAYCQRHFVIPPTLPADCGFTIVFKYDTEKEKS